MDRNLLFATSSELVRVPSEALVSVRADGNYSAVRLADGSEYYLTLQLGQIERRIAEQSADGDNKFIRIGKSLIVNREFIIYINHARQKLVMSDGRSFRFEESASREALRSLREYIESISNE
ncbi:MAG: LytTR family transcriptional regulator DNA-binding domain-containing protein [Muribaculaceae bacterium]|nr:LytTR family transcriptional regulator DNA-binding domain-containing protein [Muribaculaceae bacterium]